MGASDWLRSIGQDRAAIAGKPALIVWGLKDIALRWKEMERRTSALRDIEVQEFEDCGPLVAEEAPGGLWRRCGGSWGGRGPVPRSNSSPATSPAPRGPLSTPSTALRLLQQRRGAGHLRHRRQVVHPPQPAPVLNDLLAPSPRKITQALKMVELQRVDRAGGGRKGQFLGDATLRVHQPIWDRARALGGWGQQHADRWRTVRRALSTQCDLPVDSNDLAL